jgi:hypothetical protein
MICATPGVEFNCADQPVLVETTYALAVEASSADDFAVLVPSPRAYAILQPPRLSATSEPPVKIEDECQHHDDRYERRHCNEDH